MQLIVLGMHRSGTSVLARLLNMMGAYFGAEGISLGANAENPKGFWERRDVVDANKSVLRVLGCEWNTVLNFKPQALPKSEVANFQTQASKILLEMDSHRPWLLKDPRLCVTFPVWKPLLEVPICIHIYRNPIEVAKSLKTRNQIPINVGIALWEIYGISAISASRKVPRVFISHRALMTNPQPEVKRLYESLLELDVRGLSIPSDREINSFIQSSLYREKADDSDVSRLLNANQKRVLEEFEKGNASKNRQALKLSSSGRSALQRYERLEQNRRRDEAQGKNANKMAEAVSDKEVTTESQVSPKREAEKSPISGDVPKRKNVATTVHFDSPRKESSSDQELTRLREESQKKFREEERALISASEERVPSELEEFLKEQKKNLEDNLRDMRQSIKDARQSFADVNTENERLLAQQLDEFSRQLVVKEKAILEVRDKAAMTEVELKEQFDRQLHDLSERVERQEREFAKTQNEAKTAEEILRKQHRQEYQVVERQIAEIMRSLEEAQEALARADRDMEQRVDLESHVAGIVQELSYVKSAADRIEADVSKKIRSQELGLEKINTQNEQALATAIEKSATFEADMREGVERKVQELEERYLRVEQMLGSATQVASREKVEFDRRLKRRRTDFEGELAQKDAALEQLRRDVKRVEQKLDRSVREESLSNSNVPETLRNATIADSAGKSVELDSVSKKDDPPDARGSSPILIAKQSFGRAVSLIKQAFSTQEHGLVASVDEGLDIESSTLETTEVGALQPESMMRLVYALKSMAWFLKHDGMLYALVDDDAMCLAHLLVADFVSRTTGPIGVASVGVTDLHVNIRMDGSKGSKSLQLDRAEASVAQSFAIDPCPWTDAWLPVRFDITFRGPSQLRLRTYLPEGEGLAPKGFTISRGGEQLTSGELTRGSQSSILIEQSGDASRWDDVSIELGYAEPPSRDDERELGLVLLGIDRVSESDLERIA